MRGTVGALTLVLALGVAGFAEAREQRVSLKQQPAAQQSWPQEAELKGDYPRGAIVINVAERRLYYALGDGKALMYPRR